MFNYNINWGRLVREQIPSFLHSLIRLTFIRALIKPVKIIHAEFLLRMQGWNYEVKFNAQVILMEYRLNKYFNTTWSNITGASVIYITTNSVDPSAFYVCIDMTITGSVGANEPFTNYIGDNYSGTLTCYTIWLPVALFNSLGANNATREAIVRSVADNWNLAGVVYKVDTY
jgi:hypothetical protein